MQGFLHPELDRSSGSIAPIVWYIRRPLNYEDYQLFRSYCANVHVHVHVLYMYKYNVHVQYNCREYLREYAIILGFNYSSETIVLAYLYV